MEHVNILIIGAGPTGLGAASRLHQLLGSHSSSDNDSPLFCANDEKNDDVGAAVKPPSSSSIPSSLEPVRKSKSTTTTTDESGTHHHDDVKLNHLQNKKKQHNISYLMIESTSQPGGLASTHTTPQHFLFDLGGHVIFSHYQYFDDLIQYAVGGTFDDRTKWVRHDRTSYVYMDNVYVPYPFQLNFGKLDDVDKKMDCLNGLIDLKVERKVEREVKDRLKQTMTMEDGGKEEAVGEGHTGSKNGIITHDENNTNSSSSSSSTEHQECTTTTTVPPRNFDEWILKSMGQGINNHFMKPYNFKVWAYPTTQMSSSWLGERVATVNLDLALRNCLMTFSSSETTAADGVVDDKEDDEKGGKGGGGVGNNNGKKKGWGPNATFVFPRQGGTGGIWKAVAETAIPKDKQRYNVTMTGLNIKEKIVTCHDGTQIKYDHLINTSPLDLTLNLLNRTDLSSRLRYSSTYVFGLGLRGPNPHDKKCWLYYPQDNCPFYRCTIFSHYADGNCPGEDVMLPTLYTAGELVDGGLTVSELLLLQVGKKEDTDGNRSGVESASNSSSSTESTTSNSRGPYHSLLFEISSSVEHKPINDDTVLSDTVQGAINVCLLSRQSEVVSLFHRRLERGYPTPHVKRDEVLKEALPFLRDEGDVWNRGRFGSWKYEVGNQDHSLMLGVEAVDNILFGKPEISVSNPNAINGQKGVKQMDRGYAR